jgi:hypothetical protein
MPVENRAPRNIRLKDNEAEKPEGTYTIECFCTNCDWQGDVEIPRGTPVPYETSLERLAKCENCACETLMRFAADEELEEEEQDVEDNIDILENFRRQIGAMERDRRLMRHEMPAPIVTPDRYVPSPGYPPNGPVWMNGTQTLRSSSANPAVSNAPKTRQAVSKKASDDYGAIMGNPIQQ